MRFSPTYERKTNPFLLYYGESVEPLISAKRESEIIKRYVLLEDLRSRLKQESKGTEGTTAVVCSDKALLALATFAPRELNHLDAVPGIGHEFKERYGQIFIDAINQNFRESITKTPANEKTLELCKQLQNKLINLNKRNKLLYLPKLTAKFGIDLSTLTDADLSKKFMSSSVLKVSPKSERAFNLLSKFKRDSDTAIRETGIKDLYIATPFVIGNVNKFPVRAPLALFPVDIVVDGDSISIVKDETRDAFFNTTLLLLVYKMRGINIENIPDEYSEPSLKNFYEDLTNFYKEHLLNLSFENVQYQKFQEYTASAFPGLSYRDFVVEGNIVLGHFALRSDAISKDFNALVADIDMHPLLQELICPVEHMSDAMAESLERAFENRKQVLHTNENQTFYIDKLNKSQEDVLTFIQRNDKLVVHGPPGTGKSQTITSLIADAILKDQNVLVVSEKKTALDVVYSRLKGLSKYAFLIDDVDDKQSFYSTVANICSSELPELPINLENIANNINMRLSELDNLYTFLNSPSVFSDTPLELYQHYHALQQFIQQGDRNKDVIINKIPIDLKVMPTRQLKEYCLYFCDESHIAQLLKYEDFINKYPWMTSIKTSYDVSTTKTLMQICSSMMSDLQKAMQRSLFSGFRMKSFQKKFLAATANYADAEMFLTLYLEHEGALISAMQEYELYSTTRIAYDRLSREYKQYLKAIRDINNNCGYGYSMCSTFVFVFSLVYKIMCFEKSNGSILELQAHFNQQLHRIERLLNQKQEAVALAAANKLHEASFMLSQSKRHLDILKLTESKRKPSLANFIKKFGFELFSAARIWFLTPDTVSALLPNNPNLFDLVIFDEASQMYLEKGLPAIARAKKVIIAGDSKQLKPSSLGFSRFEVEDTLDEFENESVVNSESLLSAAEYKWPSIMLNYHYRSQFSELINFSNYAFYNAKLFVAPNTIQPKWAPITVDKVDGLWVNRQNMVEAQRIVAYLKWFFKARRNQETIGVITFNITQRDLIDDLIYEECKKDLLFKQQIEFEQRRQENGQDIGLFVKNIENVQGDERDFIIFSIGYAKNEQGKIVRNFGWLNSYGGENRLNVAITRAKKHIHIVTSIYPNELQVEDLKNKGPQLLKEYLLYACYVNNKDVKNQQKILWDLTDAPNQNKSVTFDSPFEEEVYNALQQAGYTLETQVGVGGYKIDMAIIKDGQYLLGIECDGAQYHSSDRARSRDYHRQKYLESRGWTIHRIWSTSWWRNPQQEIAKIVAMVPRN